MRRFLLFLVFACLAIAQRRGMTAGDYFAFENAGDPQISPDGKWIAYTVTTVDTKANRRKSAVYLVPMDGSSNPREFAGEAFSSTSPRWSPDGKSVAFLSARDGGKTQIWLLSTNGGEARKLTNLENGVSSIEWSPDSTHLAGLTRTGPPPSKSSDVRHYLHISYKFNDTGWFDEKRSHVVVIDAKSGEARQITEGDNWNDTDPEWSPDSTRIAFVSDRTGHELDGSHNTDVWVIPASSGALKQISDHAGPDRSPRWSPDGKRIAFLGAEDEEAQAHIYLAPSDGGKASVIGQNIDQLIAELTWGDRGKSLYFDSGVHGETHVFKIDVGNGDVRQLTTGPRNVHAFALGESGRMAYLVNDFDHLDDLYARDDAGAKERQ
ncbi:MAG TPA: hypothetical protein VKS01_00835, partial [Bryobacteraceae bacterium]|nr:hypothetical protein [Bryobacteraceae bacterium]